MLIISKKILEMFEKWYSEAALSAAVHDHSAMTISTCSNDLVPSSRIVLLRQYDQRGFVFFTNYESRKSVELKENAYASLVFYWGALDKQIRIIGKVEKISDAESDAYFASRGREKQLSAISSKQSQPLETPTAFEDNIEKNEEKYPAGLIERPKHWGGWRVIPHEIEFWQQGEHRRHERLHYTKTDEGWKSDILYP